MFLRLPGAQRSALFARDPEESGEKKNSDYALVVVVACCWWAASVERSRAAYNWLIWGAALAVFPVSYACRKALDARTGRLSRMRRPSRRPKGGAGYQTGPSPSCAIRVGVGGPSKALLEGHRYRRTHSKCAFAEVQYAVRADACHERREQHKQRHTTPVITMAPRSATARHCVASEKKNAARGGRCLARGSYFIALDATSISGNPDKNSAAKMIMIGSCIVSTSLF